MYSAKRGFGSTGQPQRHANVAGSPLHLENSFEVFSLSGMCEGGGKERRQRVRHSTFLRKEQPSVRRALPPVGWHNTVLQFPQRTTV